MHHLDRASGSYEGYLADGATALRRAVHITMAGRQLRILDEDGHPLDAWPFEGLRLSEEVYRGQPVRFVHRDKGDASLTVPSHALLDALVEQLPRLRRAHLARRSTFRRIALWGVVTILLSAGLVLGLPHLARPLAHLVPSPWETALGEVVVESFADETAPCRNAAGQAALQTLVARLAATVESPYPFQVAVSEGDRVNAFAAPGGHIVIFNGLIQSAGSAEEVAGVLAHEMAHVVRRHAMEGLIRSLGLAFVLSALVGDASALAAGLGEVGKTVLLLSYSRDDEAEADRVAVEILNRAAIGSRGLIRFFTRLRGESAEILGARQEFLSSHPLHGARIEAIAAMPQITGHALDERQWQTLKKICAVTPQAERTR